MGFELNPEYVEMTKKRLNEPFKGFDSIDPRMERVPNDLNDEKIREEYLKNHMEWFLKNYNGAREIFEKEVELKYGKMKNEKLKSNPTISSTLTLFEPFGGYAVAGL
jgi:site-specific DNA-methyltransferase (adenine-specific)